MAVLFRVATGKEDPSVISELLDVEQNPRRPQYLMASEVPLNLFKCSYDDHLEWQFDAEAVAVTMRQLQDLWTDVSVKATMLRTALDNLAELAVKSVSEVPSTQADYLYGNSKVKTYVKLLEMDKCPSLEEKLATPAAKRRKNALNE